MSAQDETSFDLGNPSSRITLVSIFTAAVIIRIVFHLSTHFMWDDAFITFRYADNLAAGHGFVYNIGEHVLGTTTPLFTLLLAAFRVIGVSPMNGSLLIGLVCSGFTAILVYRLGLRWGMGQYADMAAATGGGVASEAAPQSGRFARDDARGAAAREL